MAGNPRNVKKNNNGGGVDAADIELEILDEGIQGPPKPPAKGGMSGVAFDRAIREKMEQQKKVNNKRPAADIESDDDDDQPPPQPSNQRPTS